MSLSQKVESAQNQRSRRIAFLTLPSLQCTRTWLSGFLSGCHRKASFLYAWSHNQTQGISDCVLVSAQDIRLRILLTFLISASSADRLTPRML